MTHPGATNLMEAQGDYSAPKEGMISAKIRFALEKVPQKNPKLQMSANPPALLQQLPVTIPKMTG